MNKFYSKRGGFSIFISIVISASIILLSLLLRISEIRKEELIIQISLLQYQDYLLSQYSEILEDRYGLFATSLNDSSEYLFENLVTDIHSINSVSVKGLNELEGEVLRENILQFTRPRFPMHFAASLISRFSLIKNSITETISVNSTGKYTEIPEFSFNEITDILANTMISAPSLVGNSQVTEYAQKSLNNTCEKIKKLSDIEYYEPDIARDIKSDMFIDKDVVNKIASLLDSLYTIETSEFYDTLAFHTYVTTMFSCAVNRIYVDNSYNYRKDLRNRSFEVLSTDNSPEIEKLIFGFEDFDYNLDAAKSAIYGIRFVCNLTGIIFDKPKMMSIKQEAASLCAIVLLLSEGAIPISPEIIEIVLIIIDSATQSSDDLKTLLDGKSVELIEIESIPQVDTFYIDYLNLMIMLVPEKILLERTENIIKINTAFRDSELYTAIGVSCSYRGRKYFYEQNYAAR